MTDTTQPIDITGVILAGGSSSRFGANKALALHNGAPLITHAACILEQVFPHHLLITNTPELYTFLKWPTTGDLHAGAGPLAGIQAALLTISTQRAFIVACDMPFLNKKLIRFLSSRPGNWDAVVPYAGDRPEPLYALYDKSALPVITSCLVKKELKIGKVLNKIKVCRIHEKKIRTLVPDLGTFYNINRQEDLAAATEQVAPPAKRKKPKKPAGDMDLKTARNLILSVLRCTKPETIPLETSLDRIAAQSIKAQWPYPSFPQSTRDGYAVAARDLPVTPEANETSLKLSAKNIAAGTIGTCKLRRGLAISIMTGGMVPLGADQVVPFEKCREKNGAIYLSATAAPGAFIRKPGSDLKKKQVVLPKGEFVRPDHLPFLASAGVDTLPVFSRPRVGVLCTGSELVDLNTTPKPGQIVSGNRFLLHGLIRQAHAVPVDLGLAPDRHREIKNFLTKKPMDTLQIIITTGGMGPGKYDLVADALKELGVRIYYRALKVRPGKATLFGTLGATLFFGLPGPPPAVRLLFHELIAPALHKMQGLKKTAPAKLRPTLTAPISLKKSGILNLKGGVLTYENGCLCVRSANKLEPINAIIHIPSNRRLLRSGETVTVHTIGHPFA